MSLADDDADDDRKIVRVLDVWECNLRAIDVFQLCDVRGTGHMGGIAWQGIEPGQIHSACLLLRLPRDIWPGLAKDVALMGRAVAREWNRKASRVRR